MIDWDLDACVNTDTCILRVDFMGTVRYVADTGHIVWDSVFPAGRLRAIGTQASLVLESRRLQQKTGLGGFCPITSRINRFPFEVQLPDSYSINDANLADQIRSLN